MILKRNSLATEILYLLAKYGKTPRKEMYISFLSYEYTHFNDTLNKLIDEGYIDEFTYKRCKHLEISKKGLKAFTKTTGMEIKARVEYERRKEFRRICVNDAISMMKGAGFLVEESEKPSLFDIFRVSIMASYKNTFRDQSIFNFTSSFKKSITSRFNYAIENGVFYSSKEVREVLKYFLGENESLKLSRFVGIIFYRKRFCFVYSISNKRIEWISNNENRVVKTIIYDLKISDLLKNYISNVHPSCIIFGKGYDILQKIMFDAAIYQKRLNILNLSKVFYNAYYIPVAQYSVEQFKAAARHYRYVREYESEEFAKNYMHGIISAIQMYFVYNSFVDHSDFVVLPYIDLCELNSYLSENKKLTVYIYDKHLANPISSILRDNVVSIKYIASENPFTVEDLDYKKYTGFPIKSAKKHKKKKHKKSFF